jgi:O-antigen ligase
VTTEALTVRWASPARWTLVAGGAGVVIALAAARSTRDGIALVLALALLLALAFRAVNLLLVLVATLFADVLSFGGLTIGRLVAPVALVLLVDGAARRRLAVPGGAPLAWAACYAIWAVASGLWSVSLHSTAYLLGSLTIALVYMVAFAALTDSTATLRQVFVAVSIAAVGIGSLAILSFALGFSGELHGGRSEGGTGDANLFATYQLVALPVMLALASHVRPDRRLLVYAGALLVTGSVFTSVSRGGLVTMLAVGVLLALIPARTLFLSGAYKVAALVVVLAVGVIAYEATSTQLTARLSDKTGSGRIYEWKSAWRSVHERPVLGLGYGAFPAVSHDLLHQTPGVDLEKFDIGPKGEAVHDIFLGTLAELGIPGLVILVGLLVSTARALRSAAVAARRAGDWFLMRAANGLLLSLAALCVAAVFLSLETSRALWILVGLSLALTRIAHAPAEEERPS